MITYFGLKLSTFNGYFYSLCTAGMSKPEGQGGHRADKTRLTNFYKIISRRIILKLYILSSFYYDNTGYEFFMRGIQIKYISTLKWTCSKNFFDGDFKVILLIIHFHCEPRLELVSNTNSNPGHCLLYITVFFFIHIEWQGNHGSALKNEK